MLDNLVMKHSKEACEYQVLTKWNNVPIYKNYRYDKPEELRLMYTDIKSSLKEAVSIIASKQIRESRENAGLSTSELASIIGVSKQYVSAIESGDTSSISLKQYDRVIKAIKEATKS